MTDLVKLMNYLGAVNNLAKARGDEHAFTVHDIPYPDAAISVRHRSTELRAVAVDFVGAKRADDLLTGLNSDAKPHCPICTPDAIGANWPMSDDDPPPAPTSPRQPSLRERLRPRWSR